jgi:hypothetical protein
MVPTEQLIRADTVQQARAVFNRDEDEYDVVPWPAKGAIRGYWERDSPLRRMLTSDAVLSDGTSLARLPGLLTERDHYFVLCDSDIGGFVHFSDLNNPLMKLPLFVLFEETERGLLKALSGITESDIRSTLGDWQAKRVARARAKAAKQRVDLGWTTTLSFSALLKVAGKAMIVCLPKEQVIELVDVRNRVAHAEVPLVRSKRDVELLVRAFEAFRSLNDSLTDLRAGALLGETNGASMVTAG